MGRWAQRAALARSPPDTATAVEVGARAAALHPGSAVALTAAGRAAAAADDAEGARARLQAALALDPAHAPAMLALAQVAEASGAPEREVEAWFLAAVEADEDSPAPRVAWAAMLQRRPPPAPPRALPRTVPPPAPLPCVVVWGKGAARLGAAGARVSGAGRGGAAGWRRGPRRRPKTTRWRAARCTLG